MKKDTLVIFLAVVCAVSAQQGGSFKSAPPPLILQQTADVNPDGSFQYSYETENGIHANASGHRNASRTIQGSYSYTSPDGIPITTTYIADGNGFKPTGDHLPVAPEVPAQLTRAWAYHAAKARAKASQDKSQPPRPSDPHPALVPPPTINRNNFPISDASAHADNEPGDSYAQAPEVPAHLARAWERYAALVNTEGSEGAVIPTDIVPPFVTSPDDFSKTITDERVDHSQTREVPAHLVMAWERHVANSRTGSEDASLSTRPLEPYLDLVPPPATSSDHSPMTGDDRERVDEAGDDFPIAQDVPAHFARAWASFAGNARAAVDEVSFRSGQPSELHLELVPPPEVQ